MNPDLDHHFEQIIRGIGEDVTREGLAKTPYRLKYGVSERLSQCPHSLRVSRGPNIEYRLKSSVSTLLRGVHTL